MSGRRSVAAPTFSEVLKATKPCRYYYLGQILDGRFGWCVGTFPPREELFDILCDDDEITSSAIEVLLRQHGLPFTGEDVDIFSFYLNVMRVTCHADEAIPKEHLQIYERVTRALGVLLESLPTLAAHADDAAEHAPLWAKDGHRSKAEAFRRLHTVAHDAEALLVPAQPGRRHERWHDDAAALQSILRSIATRSGRRLGYTKPTSPAVRFIDAALTLASVKHGSVEAIAKQLERRQRRQNSPATGT
jgi:hypothetical protein